MTRVHLVATGGTIASRSGPQGRRVGASGSELLETVSPLPEGVEVVVRDRVTRPSFAFETGDLLGVAAAARDELAAGAEGVVVTHGTDTMEESAFLTELIHDDPRPVVFTGAQRPFDALGADGPANLADAIAVAADPVSRGLGVLVVFDGMAYPGHGVAKSDTLGAHAFTAPGRGPVLRVAPGRMQRLHQPRRAHLPVDLGLDELPRVDVVALYTGVDATPIRAAAQAGAAGVVLAAFGAGNANPAVVDEVGRLTAHGVPVLVCSRVPSGPVRPLYAAGGGADLERAGAVFGDDLSPWQGRLLLAAALATEPANPTAAVTRWLTVTG